MNYRRSLWQLLQRKHTSHPKKEYILVAQDKICVERFSRQENNWILTDFQNLEERLPLISVECELPLREIYDRVTFPE